MAGTVIESFGYKQLSASANVCAGAAALGCIFVSSGSATVTIYDDAATGTSTKVVDAFTATAGTFYPLPFGCSAGINIVVSGTISMTVGFVRT